VPINEEELFRMFLIGRAMEVLHADFEPKRAEEIAARLNEGQWQLRAEFDETPTGDIDTDSCRWCIQAALDQGWTLVTCVPWRQTCVHGGADGEWPDCTCTELVLAAAHDERYYRASRGPDTSYPF
jgi:hypothetical protein